jgi:hypothetical protein
MLSIDSKCLHLRRSESQGEHEGCTRRMMRCGCWSVGVIGLERTMRANPFRGPHAKIAISDPRNSRLPRHRLPLSFTTTATMRPILLSGHERALTQVKYNPDGDLIFSVSKDHVVCAWCMSSTFKMCGSTSLTLEQTRTMAKD